MGELTICKQKLVSHVNTRDRQTAKSADKWNESIFDYSYKEFGYSLIYLRLKALTERKLRTGLFIFIDLGISLYSSYATCYRVTKFLSSTLDVEKETKVYVVTRFA